ncbi:LacI family transcriptional regulator [Sediminihabitans luteus]|uniref:LacI family transcriptional regulator n=1 Tax=Sediminihabitans luteus TaxID=1138585 RepID=A0A2M9CCV2_9CELL|nr:LacI family DNA-binding transcriptional regulator [Sediminihabitans luteus]PJJ69178.1 LacI family transcriptional regulator [Sediminihabitans luteus]GII98853.1 transcriptional regulator [Sediminihabitans luteus]
MTPRPTLRDVAARAGVSKSLVSLALRGDPGVGERTRERIQVIADELGYRSNVLARGLVQGRTHLLGVVISSLENPYHTEIVAGVEEAAEAHGLSVLLVHGSRDRGRLAQHLDTLTGLNVDGLVVISSWLEDEHLAAAARRTPLVMVGRSHAPVQGIDSVTNDDELGAALAVDHLVAAGRTRVAHVTGGRRPAALARRRGYEAAMSRHGLADVVRVVDRSPGGPALQDALDEAIHDGYDAVFARNDVAAFDVIDHALDRGLRVPADLAVVGYDDSALARRTRPRLTSVNQPRERMGARAVALLVERLGGRTDDQHEVLRPTLTVRAST